MNDELFVLFAFCPRAFIISSGSSVYHCIIALIAEFSVKPLRGVISH